MSKVLRCAFSIKGRLVGNLLRQLSRVVGFVKEGRKCCSSILSLVQFLFSFFFFLCKYLMMNMKQKKKIEPRIRLNYNICMYAQRSCGSFCGPLRPTGCRARSV